MGRQRYVPDEAGDIVDLIESLLNEREELTEKVRSLEQELDEARAEKEE